MLTVHYRRFFFFKCSTEIAKPRIKSIRNEKSLFYLQPVRGVKGLVRMEFECYGLGKRGYGRTPYEAFNDWIPRAIKQIKEQHLTYRP